MRDPDRAGRVGHRRHRPLLGVVAVSATLLAGLLVGCGSGADRPAASVSFAPAASAPNGGTDVADGADAGGPRPVTGVDGVEQLVPAHPERVVTLSEPTLDAALALGVTPVGTSAGRGQSGVAPYLSALAEGVPIVGLVAQPNIEAVAALTPDLILTDGTSINNNASMIALLRQIAPTVVTGYAGGDWRENLASTAQAMNRFAQADQVLADYDARVADVAARLGDNAGAEISVVRAQNNGFSLILKELPPGRVLTDLGLRRPPEQDREGRGHSEPISNENIGAIDGDWVFLGTLGGSSVGAPDAGGSADVAAADAVIADAAANVPGFTELRAYRVGRIVGVDGSAWTSTGGPLLIATILDDVEATLAAG